MSVAELELEVNSGVGGLTISGSSIQSHTLDLSRKGITQLPDELPHSSNLQNLYLEGNQLTELPESLFSSCPHIRWLDLRNNRLTVIPPSIEKLRHLKTLLLEGNSLVSLPAQLCRLPLLTGLNICNNPIQDPPKHVIEKGTKAVLSYLRESIEEEDTNSGDSSSSLPDSGDGNSTYIRFKPITQGEMRKTQSDLPVPAMKAVILHRQVPTHTKRVSTLSSKKRNKYHPSQPRRDRKEINESLEKMKSKLGLEEWRNQAKLKQKLKQEMLQGEEQYSYVKAVEMAPFATENIEKQEVSPPPVRPLHDDTPDLLHSEMRVNQQLVQKYRIKLEEKRKQVGIITNPSSDLQAAENTLAEAMAMQEELENKKAKGKEYRFTAFTGDLPFRK